MTAIGISGTARGLIVGADGLESVPAAEARERPEEAEARKRTDAQKVFPLCSSDRTIAYALAGYVWNDDPAFDAVKECVELSSELGQRDFADATRLVNRFSKELAERINHAKHLPEIERATDGTWHILEVMFAGYFKGGSFVTHVGFTHSYRFAEFRSQSMGIGGLLYGSDIVRRAMYDNNGNVVANSPFSGYIQDPRTIETLDDSEKYVKGYIQACSSELALAMDEPYCRKIGGHIHIAELTPGNFRWRIAPVQQQSLR